ncbi:MAG TPA: tetratricopeptide repeat protein [Stellaceae bacterium]|nr:tetratricopeptide repeat protein [Stellaceae bacterium]
MRCAFALAALLVAIASPALADGSADAHAADQAAQKQDWGRAVRLYTRALDDRTLQSSDRADIYDKRGTAYYRNTDYTHALADYSEAIKLSPDCGQCFNNRGMARNQTGDYDGAIADFTAALKYEQHDPALWQVYFNRGIAWYHKNDNDHAIADYDLAIKLNPRCSPCFHDRGMAWQDKGDLAKANDDLNTADQLAH